MDAIVFGCGSSGTMTGLSRAFAQHAPCGGADPGRSGGFRSWPNTSTMAALSDKSGAWLVEGIGEDFLPQISDFSRVSKAYAIGDMKAS